jgi:hypothetical protein
LSPVVAGDGAIERLSQVSGVDVPMASASPRRMPRRRGPRWRILSAWWRLRLSALSVVSSSHSLERNDLQQLERVELRGFVVASG